MPSSLLRGAALVMLCSACTATSQDTPAPADAGAPPAAGGQASVVDSSSVPTVASVAAGSKDHTTLVAALKAANLVDALANPGPFTVFAPVNAAFDKLPPGTVESLLKPENKSQLTSILQHHVTTSALDVDALTDGQEMSMVSAGSEKITKKDGATYIGGAKIIASIHASNGWVHVIDAVLVPAK